MSNLTQSEKEQVLEKIRSELGDRPPTIGLVGVSGTGKSSTINAMFRTHLAISHTVACTKQFQDIPVSTEFTEGKAKGMSVALRVVDAPGLGEDVALDPDYIEMYKRNLPATDVILWVMTARNRAVALDQTYLERFPQFWNRIVFAVNQVDLVHPLDWNERINLPSVEMERNIEEIAADRAEKLATVLKKPVQVIPFSAAKGYNLERLFATIIDSCPPARKWIFAGLKDFSFEDFSPVSPSTVNQRGFHRKGLRR